MIIHVELGMGFIYNYYNERRGFIMENKKFYTKGHQSILKELDSNIESGLSGEVAKERLEKFGLNELEEKKRPSIFSKIIGQFSDFLVLILIGAAIVSFLVGKKKDAIVILAIVIINAILGVYQEGKAEKSLESLKKMSSSTAKVLRNGSLTVIPASQLVPGDIVYLDAGDIIPADLRLVESSNLKVEESSLTGESVPVEKDYSLVLEEDASLGDRINLGYMGTVVTYGRGKGLVVGTGHDTEIGKIATMIQSYDDQATPLQIQLNRLGKVLGITTIIVCIVVLILGLLQGESLLEMFMVAISLAVAAIPEGLPAIVTIVLAIGMNRMVKKNAIVKKLLAVETLGATTVICSDKTGTLTQNEMTVVKIFTSGREINVSGQGYEPIGEFKIGEENVSIDDIGDLETLFASAALTNDARLDRTEEGYKIIGDPTEGALVTLAEKANFQQDLMNKNYPRIKEIPFDSERKLMTTLHDNYLPDMFIAFTKGAPDVVIDRCSKISLQGKVVEFTEARKEDVIKQVQTFSRQALRVLAFAYRNYEELPGEFSSESNEVDLTFVGLVGMIDPARPEAKEAISKCKSAGIRTVMITGDYKDTAFAIAEDLGMVDSIDEAIMGKELDGLTKTELKELVKHVSVYSRVSPEHKVKIIEALRENGEVTSMTGDGVNDALALKRADIGVAMGITGTDVAKNTADLILTDDNFASIVAAVEEGRIIYSNIRKFVFFLLSCNIGEILLVLSSILLKLPIPLIPIQLLWLNLVTDSFPALALGVEKGDPYIMKMPPRDPEEPIINQKMIFRILIQSIALSGAALVSFKYGLAKYPAHINKARTIVFTSLILGELLRAYSSRSEHLSIFTIGVFSNTKMVISTLFSFGLLLAVLYIPQIQPIFNTFAIGLDDWKVIIPLALVPLLVGEVGKILLKPKNKLSK